MPQEATKHRNLVLTMAVNHSARPDLTVELPVGSEWLVSE